MREKRPVYNGYQEAYMRGEELKNKYFGCLYCEGRHHDTITNLSIPAYMVASGVKTEKTYRVFSKDYFCKVMKSETDGEVCFFCYDGPFEMDGIADLIIKEEDCICPDCGAPLEIKRGRYGEFLSCSQYPQCKYSTKWKIVENK